MESCECIQIEVVGVFSGSFSGELQTTGQYLLENTFEFVVDAVTYYIWSDGNDWWCTTTPIGDLNGAVAFLPGDPFGDHGTCPIGEKPQWSTEEFTTFTTSVGSCGVCCIDTTLIINTNPQVVNFNNFTSPAGWWNDSPYWEWCDNSSFQFGWILYKVILEDSRCQWVLTQTKCGSPISGNETVIFEGQIGQNCICPSETTFTSNDTDSYPSFTVTNCPVECVAVEDRHQRKYDAIQLPEVFEEEDRGFAKCCTKLLVLANGTSNTEENDVSSAWLNLSDPSDTFEFVVVDDNDVPTSFQPDAEAFPNEENAYFFTVQWKDILASDGEGCYSIKVTYNIGGVDGFFTWRYYELKFFTVQEALCTARIRVKFNLNQSIEGINFTGANVEDSIRFNGQIKKDQSNTEIDNLIYNSRRIETVVNENLPTYLIKTDPYTDEVLRLFTDLYLLSANEMFISDYNAHTSSYRIKDVPVIIKDTPERSSADEYSRFETISCTVTNRIANERTYY